ncbi:MAG: CaiB/BaiF CoA-transferase family protein [Pseudomonadota bacterium]
MGGALVGVRIIEVAGIGPGPFGAMMLADHGAEVIRIDRPGEGAARPETDILARSRRSISIDLKSPEGAGLVRDLVADADGLIEGFRPGVMERLGLGPDDLLARNPKLVYARMTGWGQTGPYAKTAGHDINYIALSGALHTFARATEKPLPPVNTVGDFGGGGMLLAFAMLAGILSAKNTGKGQVIDCAMLEGSSLLMSMIWGFRADGSWRDEAGVNLLDTGAHFYDVYETSDGKFISLGAIEPQFYQTFRACAGLEDDEDLDGQFDQARWPELKAKLEAVFKTKTRDEWCALLEETDACFAPVLSFAEAPSHPQNVARKAFTDIAGVPQPSPAPKFSDTPAPAPRPAGKAGGETEAILRALGYDTEKIAALVASKAVEV